MRFITLKIITDEMILFLLWTAWITAKFCDALFMFLTNRILFVWKKKFKQWVHFKLQKLNNKKTKEK